VDESLVHDLMELGRSGPFLAGAACPEVGIFAMVVYERTERRARLKIMPMVPGGAGGLSASKPLMLSNTSMAIHDHEKMKVSTTALRFCMTDAGISLVAVDVEGKVIKIDFEESPCKESVCPC
jgi:hypothetical protein